MIGKNSPKPVSKNYYLHATKEHRLQMRSPTDLQDALVDKIVEFSHLLRANGICASTAETIDAAKAATTTYTSSLVQLGEVLRITLVKRFEQYDLFTKLFNQYWQNQLFSGPSTTSATGKLEKNLDQVVNATDSNHPKQLGLIEKNAVAYSPFENLTSKKFVGLDQQREATIQRNVRTLLGVLSLREGVRYRKALRGKVDLRRTIRKSLETQGELLHVARRTR